MQSKLCTTESIQARPANRIHVYARRDGQNSQTGKPCKPADMASIDRPARFFEYVLRSAVTGTRLAPFEKKERFQENEPEEGGVLIYKSLIRGLQGLFKRNFTKTPDCQIEKT